MSLTELHQTVSERLRGGGQRYTASRQQLVAMLDRSDHPLTIAEVLAQGDGLAQSSVYRNLGVLEEVGVVSRVVTADEFARYELAEDLTGHHHHLVCASCGVVRDVVVPEDVEQALDDALARLAGDHGFTLDHHRLDLVGECEPCRAAAR